MGMDPYEYFASKSYGKNNLFEIIDGKPVINNAQYFMVLDLKVQLYLNQQFVKEQATMTRDEWAIQTAEYILNGLVRAGLEIQVKYLRKKERLVVFIHCPDERVLEEAKKRRLHDFLTGVCGVHLESLKEEVIELTPAEKLRNIYSILLEKAAKGGAELDLESQPNIIESLSPLHDVQFNSEKAKKWAQKWQMTSADLNAVKDQFGEKVGFYFAFIRYYTKWLSVPAAFGVFSLFSLRDFHPAHGFFMVDQFSPICSIGPLPWERMMSFFGSMVRKK